MNQTSQRPVLIHCEFLVEIQAAMIGEKRNYKGRIISIKR